MFENIIGQTRVIEELEKAVLTESLPGSLLFSGEHYSGKITTALELARVLSCTGDKSWNCPCRSCENHRLMLHPYLQLLGSSLFMDEINTCADILKADQPVYARYMFIRAVRKLLKRFDPVLWEGSEPKYKQVAGNAVKAEELLWDISIDAKIVDVEKFRKNIDRIVNECTKIADSYNSDNIPIDQIRKINSWAHTATDSCKIAIFENADAMGDSSRNSLLKLLEEPPAGCFFILTTSRKGAIIPTILSRVRIFNFPERDRNESAEVISRIFRDEKKEFRNIREYFLSRKTDITAVKKLSEGFINTITGKSKANNLSAVGDFKAVYNSKRLFILFIQECIELLREELHAGFDVRRAAELNKLFTEALGRREQYNQSSQLVLEALYSRAV
jgi:DNA polymerase-3 subunit gamma/tau